MKIFIPTKSRVDDQRTLKFMPEDLRKQCEGYLGSTEIHLGHQ
jgi:hypothetical protein